VEEEEVGWVSTTEYGGGWLEGSEDLVEEDFLKMERMVMA